MSNDPVREDPTTQALIGVALGTVDGDDSEFLADLRDALDAWHEAHQEPTEDTPEADDLTFGEWRSRLTSAFGYTRWLRDLDRNGTFIGQEVRYVKGDGPPPPDPDPNVWFGRADQVPDGWECQWSDNGIWLNPKNYPYDDRWVRARPKAPEPPKTKQYLVTVPADATFTAPSWATVEVVEQ